MSNPKMSEKNKSDVVDVHQAETSAEAVLRASADTLGITRKALWILGLGFGGFLLWAALAPLDEGVPTQGTVVIDTKRKPIQHLQGGLVKEVLVHEGEMVQEGQVLVRMDEAMTRANYESARQRYLGLNAMLSRLRAEQQGAAAIIFAKDVLLAAATDPYVAQQVSNQKQLFETRRQGLQADLQSLQESMEGVTAQRDAIRLVLVQRQAQLGLLSEELTNMRELVLEGYVPRNRQLELQRMQAESQASIADLKGNLVRSERTMAELSQRIVSRRSDYKKEVGSQLADIARELQADAERFSAESDNMRRVEIRSPTYGQVMGLTIQAAGTVVQSGQRLMDIVPNDQALILEARIQPHLIDKVKTGLVTDVRFNTFAHSPQLVVAGKVLSVSGDLISDPQNPKFPAYYLARIQVTPEGMKSLGRREMQPGMPAEVVIRTGERTMLKYILSPLLKRFAGAMKEE